MTSSDPYNPFKFHETQFHIIVSFVGHISAQDLPGYALLQTLVLFAFCLKFATFFFIW